MFGSVWTEAGRFAQFLALVTLGQLVVGPISQTLTVFERQDLQLACDALRFAVLLLVFFAAHHLTWSPLLTIAVLSIVMTLCHILLLVVTRFVLLTHSRACLTRNLSIFGSGTSAPARNALLWRDARSPTSRKGLRRRLIV